MAVPDPVSGVDVVDESGEVSVSRVDDRRTHEVIIGKLNINEPDEWVGHCLLVEGHSVERFQFAQVVFLRIGCGEYGFGKGLFPLSTVLGFRELIAEVL